MNLNDEQCIEALGDLLYNSLAWRRRYAQPTHVVVAINEQGVRLQGEPFAMADEAIRSLTGSNQRLLN